MKKIALDSSSAYSLLNPGNVVIVSVGDGQRDNLFSVTWNMPMRKDPGMVAIVSGKRHYSYPFIAKTGEMALNVPTARMVDAVLGCGTVSGHDGVDKFERFSLTRQSATAIKAPLVEEAFANLECRVSQVVDLGASSLLIAQIVAAKVDEEHFVDGKIVFDNGLELLHHMGGNRFCVSDRVLEGKSAV